MGRHFHLNRIVWIDDKYKSKIDLLCTPRSRFLVPPASSQFINLLRFRACVYVYSQCTSFWIARWMTNDPLTIRVVSEIDGKMDTCFTSELLFIPVLCTRSLWSFRLLLDIIVIRRSFLRKLIWVYTASQEEL